MQGKYSPTVFAAYHDDQHWHDNHMFDNAGNYDLDGYDSYGYDKNNEDRAGYDEDSYMGLEVDRFHDIANDWGFDGTRPIDKRLQA